MYSNYKIMCEMQKVAHMQEQSKTQKQIDHAREMAGKDEMNSAFQKYADPLLWDKLTTECSKLFNQFIDDVKFREAEQFKGQFFREDLYKEIYQKKDSHVNCINQFREMIMKSPTLALANENWNKLQNKNQEYKYEFAKNTWEFKKLYYDKIDKLKSVIEQSIQLSQQQQQYENTLKQLEYMRAIISQKDQENQFLRQALLGATDVIRHLEAVALEKTQEAEENNAKFLQEKAKNSSAWTKLDNFIDGHPNIEDIDSLLEIKEIIGDLQPQVDII